MSTASDKGKIMRQNFAIISMYNEQNQTKDVGRYQVTNQVRTLRTGSDLCNIKCGKDERQIDMKGLQGIKISLYL